MFWKSFLLLSEILLRRISLLYRTEIFTKRTTLIRSDRKNYLLQVLQVFLHASLILLFHFILFRGILIVRGFVQYMDFEEYFLHQERRSRHGPEKKMEPRKVWMAVLDAMSSPRKIDKHTRGKIFTVTDHAVQSNIVKTFFIRMMIIFG